MTSEEEPDAEKAEREKLEAKIENLKAAKAKLEKTFSLWNLPSALAGALAPYFIPYFGVRWALPDRPLVAALISLISLALFITAAWWLAHSLAHFLE